MAVWGLRVPFQLRTLAGHSTGKNLRVEKGNQDKVTVRNAERAEE